MSSDNSICFFMLGNYFKHKEIGTYYDETFANCSSADLETIITTSNNILNDNKQLKSRNKQILQNYNIYYTVTVSDTLYLAATKKSNPLNDEENVIFKLFNTIESQGIKKLTDKNGELTKIGKQNLKFCISKCEENYYKQNPSILDFFSMNKEREQDNSKMSLLSTQINEIQDTVRDGFKSLINNVENMQDLDDKSGQIKDSSFKFQQDAAILEKKIRCRKLTTRIIIIVIAIVINILIFYFIFR